MARLARARQSPVAIEDSEDEYSAAPTTKATAAKSRTSPRKRAQKSYAEPDPSEDDSGSDFGSKLVIKAPTESARAKRQIKLAPLKASGSSNELRQKIVSPERSRRRPLNDVTGNRRASSKSGLPRLNAFASVPSLKPPVVASDDQEEEEAEVEESVWCGSDASAGMSDDELPSPRKLWPGKRSFSTARQSTAAPSSLDEALQGFQGLSIRETTAKNADRPAQSLSDERPSSSHDKENLDAILRFSPPRLATRLRAQTPERPVTPPPASPSKSRLVSPSKTKIRIPTPPHRQSLDGFWNADTVNDWNDQYSPQKTLKSPNKNLFSRDQEESTSPKPSPKKSSSSPNKRTAAEVRAKKDFAARKHALAESFLAELDQTITSGQIASLSASTGGVRLIWSKTLNSTAGRANWRRETIKARSAITAASTSSTAIVPPPANVIHKHHASIELAEKVIDDETRLLNVLAHEFCHLANFMVSGIKDQPHGTSFKAWGAKCTAAFGAREVHVTTKHSYAIDYKYVWKCDGDDCGAEFKRHSKSIDPKKHTCGSCRGKLVQIKPVPRGGAGAVVGGKVGGYAGFVKMHFAEVRKNLPPGSSQKEVMEAVGRKYREEKEKGKAEQGEKAHDAKLTGGSGVEEELSNALNVVVLDD